MSLFGSPPSSPGGADSSVECRGYTIFGRTFDRLSIRLGVGITFLIVGPVGIAFYSLSRHHFDQTIQARRKALELQGRILEVALRHQMLDPERQILPQILHEIGSQPEIRTAMILNHHGEVRISSEEGAVGEKISRESATCFVCHAKEPEDRDRWVFLNEEGGQLIRSVLPIENRSECHVCHGSEERLNGILILDVSMDEVRAGLDRDLLWIAGGTLALAVALLAGTRFLVRRLLLVRLEKLGGTARSIAAGNLAERVPVEGDDLITSLARDFNRMADASSRLIEDVRDRESRLASVMNSLDDGLLVVDRDSRVVAINRSFCRRLGTHPESLQGRRCGEIVYGSRALPCCSSGEACPASLCVSTGRVHRAIFRTSMPGGEPDTVEEVHASPVFDDDGNVVQVVELWRDITERAREEEHLAEIERLVSLGTLASGFSHEVNTPLASMLTCAESVIAWIDEKEAEDGDDPLLLDIREYADTIRKQVLRCKRITEQFLRFSRGIPPSIEPIDLREVVSSVVTLVRPTAEESGVTLSVDDDGPLPGVDANAEVVQHVALNLLINAIQSCESAGGRVGLSFVVGEDVRLRIQDTGCGIPAERHKHLFEPFHSQKPRGTGLGLFLSRSFMRRFGGDVTLLESEPGVGSCFEVLFLASEDGK